MLILIIIIDLLHQGLCQMKVYMDTLLRENHTANQNNRPFVTKQWQASHDILWCATSHHQVHVFYKYISLFDMEYEVIVTFHELTTLIYIWPIYWTLQAHSLKVSQKQVPLTLPSV